MSTCGDRRDITYVNLMSSYQTAVFF